MGVEDLRGHLGEPNSISRNSRHDCQAELQNWLTTIFHHGDGVPTHNVVDGNQTRAITGIIPSGLAWHISTLALRLPLPQIDIRQGVDRILIALEVTDTPEHQIVDALYFPEEVLVHERGVHATGHDRWHNRECWAAQEFYERAKAMVDSEASA